MSSRMFQIVIGGVIAAVAIAAVVTWTVVADDDSARIERRAACHLHTGVTS